MVVLPMGLGVRLGSVPAVTLTLAVLWILTFSADYEGRQVGPALIRTAVGSGMVRETRRLFTDYCTKRSGREAPCRALAGRLAELPRAQDRAAWPGLGAFGAVDFVRPAAVCSVGRCGPYGEILLDFRTSLRKRPTELKRLSSYSSYKAASDRYRQGVEKICREKGCLVPGNVNAGSLLTAQFRHAGPGHLFANLVVLLVFGAYVEQRGNRLAYALTLMLGGTVGLALHATLIASGEAPVVGGSANVAAVLGMFLVLFWRQRMRLLVWIGTGFKTFRAPIVLCIPLLYLLTDIAGGLTAFFGEAAGVARVAHLAGFAVGGLAALTMARLPRPFLFESEIESFRKLRRTRDLKTLIDDAREILARNPDNHKVMEWTAWRIVRWTQAVDVSERAALYARARSFLKDHLAAMAAIRCRRGDHHQVCRILGQMPLYMRYSIYLHSLGQVNIIALGDYALVRGDYWLALRLYDHYLTRYRHTRKAYDVYRTCLSILSSMELTPLNSRFLRAYLFFNRTSPLAVGIRSWLAGRPPVPSEEAYDAV